MTAAAAVVAVVAVATATAAAATLAAVVVAVAAVLRVCLPLLWRVARDREPSLFNIARLFVQQSRKRACSCLPREKQCQDTAR